MFCPNGHENDPVCWLKWSGTVVCCLAAVSPRCQDNIPPRPHGDKVSDTYVLEMLMRYETSICGSQKHTKPTFYVFSNWAV